MKHASDHSSTIVEVQNLNILKKRMSIISNSYVFLESLTSTTSTSTSTFFLNDFNHLIRMLRLLRFSLIIILDLYYYKYMKSLGGVNFLSRMCAEKGPKPQQSGRCCWESKTSTTINTSTLPQHTSTNSVTYCNDSKKTSTFQNHFFANLSKKCKKFKKAIFRRKGEKSMS